MKDNHIIECTGVFEKIHSIQKRICIRDKVVAAREGFRAGRLVRENEWRNYFTLAMNRNRQDFHFSLFPLASTGAVDGHIGHSFDEQGMSCRRYSSRTIFCTFPLFVDLTKILLVTFSACGFADKSLRKLFILDKKCCPVVAG